MEVESENRKAKQREVESYKSQNVYQETYGNAQPPISLGLEIKTCWW